MRKIIFSAFVVCFAACQRNQKESSRYTNEQVESLHLETAKTLKAETDSLVKIDLNPFLKKQSFDFGSLVKEIKLTPLETTTQSLVDNIRKLLVTDSNIYIHDDFNDGSVVIFDRQGRFIKRLPSGRGPGELNRMYSISFDDETNELVVHQHSFLLFFSPTGKFIRQKRLPFGFRNFETSSNGYIFKTFDNQGNGHLGNIKNSTLLVTDKNFGLKSVGLPYFKTNINLAVPTNLYRNKNTYYLTQRFTDTVFQYANDRNQLKAKYMLDYSSKKIPNKYLEKNWDTFKNALIKNDYYFYLGDYLDSNSHHVFTLNSWYNEAQTIIFRDKESGNLKGGTIANYNPKEIPSIAFAISVSNDYFISAYYPNNNDVFSTTSTLVSAEDKLKIKNSKEDDNPVLIFFKLKKF